MKIPPFWVRRKIDDVVATGWSFTSRDDAQARAAANARQIAATLASGGFAERGKLYYSDRPLREPIMREFRDERDQVSGVVTRNIYGALVLNTAAALFVDVDFPTPKPLAGSLFERLVGLLGRKKLPTPPTPPPEIVAMERAEAWRAAHRPWEWRVYRTKAGMRFLATHATFQPADPRVQEVFDALDADPLYRKLCKAQECFRARLTPKPWRCDYYAPTQKWPFIDSAIESGHQQWENGYLEKCQSWSTCELVTTTGTSPVHPALAELITFHDAATRISSGLPLA